MKDTESTSATEVPAVAGRLDLGLGPLYAERDHVAQGEHFVRHLSAMTGEGLHAKSAIAAELAARDIEIERLRGLLQEALEVADNWPGVAYTADLIARCKVAMPGWAPLYE